MHFEQPRDLGWRMISTLDQSNDFQFLCDGEFVGAAHLLSAVAGDLHSTFGALAQHFPLELGSPVEREIKRGSRGPFAASLLPKSNRRCLHDFRPFEQPNHPRVLRFQLLKLAALPVAIARTLRKHLEIACISVEYLFKY